ncbi:MAG TPA: hypothetical protein VE961_24660 [Pyrinomonadaceae bacterium]|nr:hypothetical protein [Pyrinomonadaceae bacterium]
MNTAFRLTLSLSFIISLAGLTFASTAGDRVDLAEFACHPEALAGRNIEVNANIVAINADGKSLELFDSQTRTRIDVRLTQLRKADRLALLHSDVRRVSVSGLASVVGGRLTIDAQSIQAAPVSGTARLESNVQPPATAVVSLTDLN